MCLVCSEKVRFESGTVRKSALTASRFTQRTSTEFGCNCQFVYLAAAVAACLSCQLFEDNYRSGIVARCVSPACKVIKVIAHLIDRHGEARFRLIYGIGTKAETGLRRC